MSKPSHVFSVSFISQAVKTTLGYIPLYGKWEYNLALFLQQFTHCDPRRTHTSSQEQLDTYFPTSEKGHDKQVNLTLNLSTCVPTSTSSKKAWVLSFVVVLLGIFKNGKHFKKGMTWEYIMSWWWQGRTILGAYAILLQKN